MGRPLYGTGKVPIYYFVVPMILSNMSELKYCFMSWPISESVLWCLDRTGLRIIPPPGVVESRVSSRTCKNPTRTRRFGGQVRSGQAFYGSDFFGSGTQRL